MNRLLATLGTMAAVAGFAYQADGATLGALNGRAWKHSDTECFETGSYSSAVTNECSTEKSYLVPVQIPSNATTDYRFYATSTAPPNTTLGAPPRCRVVVVNRFSTEHELSSSVDVWNNTTIASSMEVYTTDTAQFDCRLPGDDLDIRYGLSSVRFAEL